MDDEMDDDAFNAAADNLDLMEEGLEYQIMEAALLNQLLNQHIDNNPPSVPSAIRRILGQVHDFISTSMAKKRLFKDRVTALSKKVCSPAQKYALDSLEEALAKDHLQDLQSSAQIINFEGVAGFVNSVNVRELQKVLKSVSALVHVVMRLDGKFEQQIVELESNVKTYEDFDCLFRALKSHSHPAAQKIVADITRSKEDRIRRAEEEKTAIRSGSAPSTSTSDHEPPTKEELRRTLRNRRPIVKEKVKNCLVNRRKCGGKD